MHGSDWLPTILGLTGTPIGKIETDLQNKLYIPVAKRVSLRLHNTTDKYKDYLVESSFDGIDLSQWLLYGNVKNNRRTHVGLSINDLDPQDEDISIVFESNVTGHRYKFMKLVDTPSNAYYCTYCYNDTTAQKQRCKINAGGTSLEMLFDLTIDSNETSNLKTTNSKSVNQHKPNNKNKNKNKNYNHVSILELEDYKKSQNVDLVDVLWEEAEIIVEEYMNNVLYNDYLSCQSWTYSESNPAFFGDAWSPFFSWEEYQGIFQNTCGDTMNQVLLEMYLTLYQDY